MLDRDLSWLGTSLADVQGFPEDARRATGFQLRRIQQGMMPSDWKSMPTVGAGVFEIRIRGPGEHRVLYVAKFSEAIYILHAFEKKTQRTRKADIDIGRTRLKGLLTIRQNRRTSP